MDGKAQPAFERADVVLEEVRVFVQVYSLERELPQSLTSVCIGTGIRSNAAAAELGASTILQTKKINQQVGSIGRIKLYLLDNP